MLNLRKVMIKAFIEETREMYQQTYGLLEPGLKDILLWSSHVALENISNCNALYHNLDHTIMVVLAGQQILRGKHMLEGVVTPKDWLHCMIALLCHDIGYVKGICRLDNGNVCATGIDEQTVQIAEGETDAVLAPYHVDRAKLFVRERFAGKVLVESHADIIASYIEMTRFPFTDELIDTQDYPGLTRAADLIGQLGDPNYLNKIPALFYEFEESGINAATGYKNPKSIRESYAIFYNNEVSPYIQDALRYLHVTQEGKQWIASLYSNVFAAEHGTF